MSGKKNLSFVLTIATLLLAPGCAWVPGSQKLLAKHSIRKPDNTVKPTNNYHIDNVSFEGSDKLAATNTTIERESRPEVIAKPSASSTNTPTLAEPVTATGSASEPIVLSLESARLAALQMSPSLRVFHYAPEIAQPDIVIADSYFDTVFGVGVEGGKYDRQVSNQVQSFGGVFDFQQTDFLNPIDDNDIYLAKELRTGGNVEVGIATNYNFFDPLGGFVTVNPAWFSSLNFSIEQPLGQGLGSKIAEIEIGIARANYLQSESEVREQINALLRDVDLAYLEVHLAEMEYQSLVKAVEQARKTTSDAATLLEKGAGTRPDLLDARGQLFELGYQQSETQQRLLSAKQELLRLVGYPSTTELATQPLDSIDQLASHNDWETAVSNMYNRPILRAQQHSLNKAQLILDQQCDRLRPDISVHADYAVTGLADRLDDSFDVIGENRYNDWLVGVKYETPLGKRGERAAVRKAKFEVSRERATLNEITHNLTHELDIAYKRLYTAKNLVEVSRQRREIADQLYSDRLKLYEKKSGGIGFLVIAQDRRVDAALKESQAMIEYRKALVQWNYAQGILISETASFIE